MFCVYPLFRSQMIYMSLKSLCVKIGFQLWKCQVNYIAILIPKLQIPFSTNPSAAQQYLLHKYCIV